MHVPHLSEILPCVRSAEEVEAILEGSHHIAVNAVSLTVLARIGTDGAADVASLAQNVVCTQHDGSSLLVQESVADLSVPYQFVRVHAG